MPRAAAAAGEPIHPIVALRALRVLAWPLLVMGCVTLLLAHPAAAGSFWHNAVEVVAPDRMTVATDASQAAATGDIPLFLSAGWTHPLPGIRHAIIVVHGIDRNAAATMRGAQAARAAAGATGQATLLIVPQFLVPIDVRTFHLPPTTLRWTGGGWTGGGWPGGGWTGGEAALSPAPISSFGVLDAILQRLADRTLFPNLETVVVAGHSAGGQIVQRYAVVGHDVPALAARGLRVRYVVANPSSYLYFSDDRPAPVNAGSCPGFDRWKFGLAGAPPYVSATAGLEARYAAQDVTYLLGTADNDPRHIALDRSCGAEAQGPYRLARGEAFFAYMKSRHPTGLNQRMVLVPGVAHSSVRMFGSVCGVAVLFDRPGCPPE